MLQTLILASVLLTFGVAYQNNRRLKTMTAKTEELIATVTAQSTVIAAAVAALNGQTDNTETLIREAVAAALADDAASDASTEAAVNAAIDQAIATVRAQTDALAAAVPVGTAAEDEEPAETVEGGEGDDSLPAGEDSVEGA